MMMMMLMLMNTTVSTVRRRVVTSSIGLYRTRLIGTGGGGGVIITQPRRHTHALLQPSSYYSTSSLPSTPLEPHRDLDTTSSIQQKQQQQQQSNERTSRWNRWLRKMVIQGFCFGVAVGAIYHYQNNDTYYLSLLFEHILSSFHQSQGTTLIDVDLAGLWFDITKGHSALHLTVATGD